MMSPSVATSLLVLLSLSGASHASNLRTACPPISSNSTLSRCLEDDGGSISTEAELLNRLIAVALPRINEAIKENVPDPLNIDLSDTYSVGSVDIGCDDPVTAGFNFALGGKKTV